ncbi:MAG: ACT domain-containing protein [Desulfurococcales archaeon]|nr:ACT domain-containing protein [Desulfurococcales archaeon]
MRLTSLAKVDSKGRITIPQTIRETLDIEPGMFMALIADLERREIIVTPIYTKGENIYEVEVTVVDKPGSLAKLTEVLAENNIDIIANRCASIMRREEASCTMIVDTSESGLTIDDLKRIINEIDIVTQVKVKSFETII